MTKSPENMKWRVRLEGKAIRTLRYERNNSSRERRERERERDGEGDGDGDRERERLSKT